MITDTTLSDAEQGANRRAMIAEGQLEPSRPFCWGSVAPKSSTHNGKRKGRPDAATSRQASDASGAEKTRQADPRNLSDGHLAGATTNRPRVVAPNVVPAGLPAGHKGEAGCPTLLTGHRRTSVTK